MTPAAAVVAAIVLTAVLVSTPARAVPAFADVRAAHAPSDLTLLDRHGEPLQVLRIDPGQRRLPWQPLEAMSPALLHAIVLSEDRRFWSHAGVDWSALAASAWANAWNTRTRGASTVTMQLAGLIDEDLARPEGGRGIGAKLGQIVVARRLESQWTKTQILEAYLNRVPLRGESVGVPAAAWTMFGKHPAGLDSAESALLAVLLRGPNATAATLKRRACELLGAMQQGCAGLAATVDAALARQPGPAPGPQWAPHWARQWWAAQPATRQASLRRQPAALRTTLDARVQRVARAALRQQLAELQGHSVHDGALVVLDNASGEVRAWVGSSGAMSDAGDVDFVLARRQPGSTIKPFVYALAFERGLLDPGTWLDDSPLQLPAGGDALYMPQNYDRGHKGLVTAATALASSLNVPTVRVAAMLGPEAIFDRLQASGLQLGQSAGFHGHALALGSAETRLIDLANAYRMLANGGLYRPLALPGPTPHSSGTARRVFAASTARQVTRILADPAARAPTFGFDSVLATRRSAAVKTGTSKDLRDNWCIGFDDRHTVAAWVGNAGGEPMHAVSGTSGAAPAWQQTLAWLQAQAPPGTAAGAMAVGTTTTLAGHRPPPGAVGRFGIEQPRHGSVIALDPEIPPASQRLAIAGAPARWQLSADDGRRIALGRGDRFSWPPQPGRWTLERRAADGAVLDRVRFEVRLPPVGGGRARR